MTYPPSGTPDPYQPQQPYGPGSDPTAQDPYAAPGSGVPASGSGAPASDVPGSGIPGSGIPGNGPPPGAYGSPQYPSSGQPYGQSPYDQNPYGQQQYGPPQYGQSPYGQPQGQSAYGQPQYAGYGPQARTNGLAIASLVCSLAGLLTCISAPVGVVLGHIARRQIRETGEQGEGLATAGLWVGYILSVLGLLFIAFYVVIIVFAIAHGDATST